MSASLSLNRIKIICNCVQCVVDETNSLKMSKCRLEFRDVPQRITRLAFYSIICWAFSVKRFTCDLCDCTNNTSAYVCVVTIHNAPIRNGTRQNRIITMECSECDKKSNEKKRDWQIGCDNFISLIRMNWHSKRIAMMEMVYPVANTTTTVHNRINNKCIR